MTPLEHENLLSEYFKWLKEQYIGANLTNAVEITTPFLDQHNDNIQLYVEKENSALVISDDCYTLNNLKMSGCDLDTDKRKEILYSILTSFGIKLDDDKLFIEATKQSFPKKMHAFLQAVMAINDLFVLARPTIENIFKEDVETFLSANNIRFFPSFKLPGKSGFDYLFHFAIPGVQNSPDKIIQAINNPSKQNTMLLLGQWQDVNHIRPKSTLLYPVLNYQNHKISDEVLAAYTEYNAKPILWSERKKYIKELAA